MTQTQNTQNTQNRMTVSGMMFGGLLKSCIIADIDRLKLRKSAWNRGLKQYMHDFIEDIDMTKLQACQSKADFEKLLLNGAKNWHEYSWGGASLCYNEDILKRLSPAWACKKFANSSMVYGVELLDIQKRALYQAFLKLYDIIFVYSNFDTQTRKKYFLPA